MRESDYVLMTVIHEVLVNSDEATTLLGVIFVIGLVTTGLWRVADQFIPTSKKLQETPLPLKESSPWHSHGLSQEDYSSQSRRLNSLSEKLLSDGRLIIKYLRIYWSPYWLPSVISALCLMIKPAYQLLFAQQLGVIIDNGVSIMVSSALALGGVLPIVYGFTLLGERLSARLSNRITNDIRYDLFSHLQALSQSFHKQSRSGDLVSNFSIDINKAEMALGEEIVLGISDLIVILVYVVVMLRINGSLAFISLLPIAVTLPLLVYLTTNASHLESSSNTQNALMMDAVQQSIRGQPMIAAYGLQSLFAGYFSDELKRLEDKKTEGQFGFRLLQQSALFFAYLLSAWSIGMGAWYVLTDRMTLGAWLAFFSIYHSMYDILFGLFNMRLPRWIDASVGLQRIDRILAQPTQVIDVSDAYPLPPLQQNICFEHLSFGYDDSRYQVQELNLEIASGQFVAFVGSSGAGKSTVFNLLMRFYDPSNGRITIDNHDLRHIKQESLRSQMGVVLQETFLFNTTILNNIRITKPDATDAEVIEAAQAAELHDFILSLPDGYQTLVGEGGGRLSGGQRQRIAIARALLYSPAILLLDEPTSSLSAEIADAINHTVMALAGKHTVIMITHQLRSAIHANRIFVLDQGRLVEQGTHHDLLLLGSHYRHLWDVQGNTPNAGSEKVPGETLEIL